MSKLALLHPDHLLDGARRDALPPEAWRQLGSHLAVCDACAWEHAATGDFARAHAASRADPDPAQLDRIVDGALARAGLARAKPPVRTRSALRWVAASAMVAATIGAALVAALPVRPMREGSRVDPFLASAGEARLDAGALGPTFGGDS